MAKCKSCSAAIRWVKTTRGKSMPIDDKPNPAGNVWLDVLGVANVLAPGENPPEGVRGRWISHFATCPQAAQHRKEPA